MHGCMRVQAWSGNRNCAGVLADRRNPSSRGRTRIHKRVVHRHNLHARVLHCRAQHEAACGSTVGEEGAGRAPRAVEGGVQAARGARLLLLLQESRAFCQGPCRMLHRLAMPQQQPALGGNQRRATLGGRRPARQRSPMRPKPLTPTFTTWSPATCWITGGTTACTRTARLPACSRRAGRTARGWDTSAACMLPDSNPNGWGCGGAGEPLITKKRSRVGPGRACWGLAAGQPVAGGGQRRVVMLARRGGATRVCMRASASWRPATESAQQRALRSFRQPQKLFWRHGAACAHTPPAAARLAAAVPPPAGRQSPGSWQSHKAVESPNPLQILNGSIIWLLPPNTLPVSSATQCAVRAGLGAASRAGPGPEPMGPLT